MASLKESLDITTKIYGENNIFTAKALNNLGNAYRISGNKHEAKKLLERSKTLIEQYYNYDQITLAQIIGNIGLLYGDLGDNTKKDELLKNALSIFQKNLPPENPYILKVTKELDKLKRAFPQSNGDKITGYYIIIHLY